ncbi:hypothetical protein MUK42_11933 [Musa troglodytarum]|uniref:Coatomer subunit zeta n=1 Tax=Musa troglodytarum TaxID=320322 RepID=A0A9E7H0Q7_9LILI|nr:hypothetical protein MUK42_11933 [Musa troglodytarum]
MDLQFSCSLVNSGRFCRCRDNLTDKPLDLDLFDDDHLDCCPSIKNVLLLDSEGKRVAVKYYTDDWPTLAAKLAYEKSIFTKTLKTNARTEVLSPFTAEIAMLDGYIVVYKFIQDLHFFVTGGDDENELIIATVLQGFFDAVGLLLRIVLETEPSVIASKVAANSLDGATSLSEQLIHKN